MSLCTKTPFEDTAETAPVEALPNKPFEGKQVLLVDDNDINLEVATHMLESLGLKVITAMNGQEAVNTVVSQTLTLDAVLMDIQMPIMDGHDATITIRGAGISSTQLPIIAMTAHAFDSERQKCLESGMNDHISKPIQKETLLKTLAKVLIA